MLCWTRRESFRPWTAAIAIAITAVPPLRILGWASPLVAAGALFPNAGWFGLAAVLALPGLLLRASTRVVALVTAAAASLLLNAQVKPLRTPGGWEAEMTRIHRQAKADDFADFAIEERLQRAALSSHARFLVFPEGAVRRWTDATDVFWSTAISDARRTLVIGAGQPVPGTSRYHNSVEIVGEQPRPPFHQRIPVPGGMWNPLRPMGSFALNLFGPGTVDVGGERTAILICYERPILRSALERPTLLIAISNEAWTAATIVPRVQHTSVRAWARLFGLRVISAINS